MSALDLSDRALPFTPGVEILNGKVWTVRPVTVVKDAEDEIALWEVSSIGAETREFG